MAIIVGITSHHIASNATHRRHRHCHHQPHPRHHRQHQHHRQPRCRHGHHESNARLSKASRADSWPIHVFDVHPRAAKMTPVANSSCVVLPVTDPVTDSAMDRARALPFEKYAGVLQMGTLTGRHVCFPTYIAAYTHGTPGIRTHRRACIDPGTAAVEGSRKPESTPAVTTKG